MKKTKLESDMEEAAKKGITDLVVILSTSLTVAGKQNRMIGIAESLKRAASDEEE